MGFTPPALLDRPKLEGELAIGYSIFCEVSLGRKYSQGYPLRIGPREMLDYFQLHHAKPDEYAAVSDMVFKIDDAWLSCQVEERDAARKKVGTNTPA